MVLLMSRKIDKVSEILKKANQMENVKGKFKATQINKIVHTKVFTFHF